MGKTNMTLNAILKTKPPGFISVLPEMRISGVIAVLAEKRIGAVLVVDPDTHCPRWRCRPAS
jgi:CBS domain-containing protein